MQSRGLRRYHERRRALAEARNVSDLRRLEGPGSEERLRGLQSRFRRLQDAGARRALRLPLACAIVFVGVLTAGLLSDRVF